MKRILAMLLALLMITSAALATELAPGVYKLEDGTVDIDFGFHAQFPLVTDGSVKLTIAIPRNDTYGIDAEDMWFWKWFQQETGIDFEIEQVSQAGLAERKNIMLASGDLPDILWGFGFSSTDLVRYGDSEELFLDLKEYITPEIMPNLSKFVEAYPDTMANISTPTGAVYSFPYYRAMFAGYSSDMYIDQNLLDEYGLEIPTTLDDFTAMLRLFKEKNPDIVPLSGGTKFCNPFYYILNAYGFLGGSNNNGDKITMRDGKPVIPANDPVFKEALATMKMYYDEGLISEDFFTTDDVTVKALMAEGKVGVYGQKAYMATPNYEDFSHWTAVKPLTSAYNDKQQWLAADAMSVGGWVVSADTEHAELIARLTDFFYSNFGTMYFKYGPLTTTNDTLGMTLGVDFDPEQPRASTYRRLDYLAGTYANATEYEVKVAGNPLVVGNDGAMNLWSDELNITYWVKKYILGTELDYSINLKTKYFDPMHIDNNARISCDTNLFPYEIAGYPNICYYSAEQNDRIVELSSVLSPYIEAEVAKFITGARSLDEFDAFQAELDSMGIDELEAIHVDYYNGLAK